MKNTLYTLIIILTSISTYAQVTHDSVRPVNVDRYWGYTSTTQDRQYNNVDVAKSSLIISGISLIMSSICDVTASNMTVPTNSQYMQSYTNKQRNLSSASSICKATAGVTLIIGIVIYIK